MNQDYSDCRILILDDDPQINQQLDRMLRWDGYQQIKAICDPECFEESFSVFQPDLVLLDLVMPRRSGFDVLSWVCSQTTSTFLPVLVLTGDVKRETRALALELGANDFLNKPIDETETLLRVRNLLHTRRLHLMVKGQNERLERRVRERTADLENARYEILRRLAVAAEYRDDATGEHTRRVAANAERLARKLSLPPEVVRLIAMGSPLHDIGKIGVPDTILRKPGKLTAEEFEVVKSHTTVGANILAGSNVPLLRTAEDIARWHHEKWDGSGYPDGLANEDIPLSARIVGIVDVFDALTHERPYKPAWTKGQAVEEIQRLSGTHFDPNIAHAFCQMLSDPELTEEGNPGDSGYFTAPMPPDSTVLS